MLTVDDALDPGSPLVQDPDLREGPLANTNTLREWIFGWGDVDAATADCVIEQTYSFPMVTHFAIEPHVFLAAPDGDGITVWSAIQHPVPAPVRHRQAAGDADLQGAGDRT